MAFSVPASVREYAPGEAVGVCSNCLTVLPIEEAPASQPDPAAVSEELPSDPDVAVMVLLAGSLMGSLALNRQKVEAVLSEVEDAGVDPHLVFERLVEEPGTDPAVALTQRYRQLEQLRG